MHEDLVAELRDLFDEVAHLSRVLVDWDGGSPPRSVLEERIAAAEARIAAIERGLRT